MKDGAAAYVNLAERPEDEKNERLCMIRRLADSSEPLSIRMTNDFAMKRVLHNKKALTGFLSGALEIPPGDIKTLEFPETVLRGEYAEEHEGILDVRVILNSDKKINVELQIKWFPNWTERSLFYVSKMFVEGFEKGHPYGELEKCIHIGILGFNLDNSDDFYSTIELRDSRTGQLYSDKLSLRVLYLDKLEMASEEEKKTDIYLWARMITAPDWEVLKEMASQDEYRSAALEELEKINSDKELRYQYLRQEMLASDRATIREAYVKMGEEKGEQKGELRVNHLIQLLLQSSRSDEIGKAVSDREYQKRLFEEFGI